MGTYHRRPAVTEDRVGEAFWGLRIRHEHPTLDMHHEMSRFRPRDFYFHSCEEAKSREEKETTPLHYHLNRGDIVAFRHELRSGTSPLIVDTCGRTVLDILISQIEDLFFTGLSTSLLVDDLLYTLRQEYIFPAKFALEDHRDITCNLYPDPYLDSLNDDRTGYPKNQQSFGQNGLGTVSSSRIRLSEDQPQPKFPLKSKLPEIPKYPPTHDRYPTHIHDTSVVNPYKHSVKLSVEDGVIRRPLSHKTLLEMKNFVHRIRILINLARELITCEYLTSLVIDRRRNDIGLPLWLGDLVEPYFYTTLLELFYDIYPHAPDKQPWRKSNIIDDRTLVGIICRFELNGHEVLLFLGELLSLLTEFLTLLPAGYSENSEFGPYLLEMSFVLDVPQLFEFLDSEFGCVDGTGWKEAKYEMISACPKAMSRYIRILDKYC